MEQQTVQTILLLLVCKHSPSVIKKLQYNNTREFAEAVKSQFPTIKSRFWNKVNFMYVKMEVT